ncbi:MAG: hypothetical protein GX333_07205 [Syntrophomonadaceae bacterium]|nr:hypothetical protein [Syntrophomonadaceae bacterium]
MSKDLYSFNDLQSGVEYDNSPALFNTSFIAEDKKDIDYIDFNVCNENIVVEGLDFWDNVDISHENQIKAQFLRKSLAVIVKRHPEIKGSLKGRGLTQGIACGISGLAKKIAEVAKENGLLIGNYGENHEVIMIMPPDSIDIYGLEKGLEILSDSISNPKIQLMIRQYNSAQRQNIAAF